MKFIDHRPQLASSLLTEVSPKLLKSSAQISNSAFEVVQEYYSPNPIPRKPMTENGLKASYYGSLAHQMMMFYFLLKEKNDFLPDSAKDRSDIRTTHMSESTHSLITEILQAIHPLSSHLSVKEQTVLAMKCWMTMQDFSTKKVDYSLLYEEELPLLDEAKRVSLWLDGGNRNRLTATLNTIDALAQKKRVARPRSFLLESPYILTYLYKETGIQSWVQPDRIQHADGKTVVIDYKFGQKNLHEQELGIADWIQIASLSVVGALRHSFLAEQRNSEVKSAPDLISLPIEQIPHLINNVHVIYENPEKKTRDGIEQKDVTLSDEKLTAVVQSLMNVSQDFAHPDTRAGFRSFLKDRTYISKLLSPTPLFYGSLEDQIEEIARLNVLYLAYA